MKRTPLRRMSPKTVAAMATHAAIRELLYARDGRCVLWGRTDVPPCGGAPLTPHHLRKASQGGKYTLTNLIVLCSAHNGWVEDNPNLAHELGLVIRRGDTAAEAHARRLEHGIGL